MMRNRSPLSIAPSALALIFAIVFSSLSLSAQEIAVGTKTARRASRAANSVAYPLKRVAVRADEVPAGTRVLISTDAPLEGHRAFVEDDRLHVLIPGADASSIASPEHLRGSGFGSVEQSGDDALVKFSLRSDVSPRVRASFNRLEVLLVAQEGAQAQANSNKDASSNKEASNSGDTDETASVPAPTPAPASSGTASSTAAGEGAPASAPAAGTNSTAPATSAARYTALLTPEKANPVRIKRFENAPVIDGKLDEEVWKSAAVFKDFIQFRPGDLIAPSKPTEAYMGYDSKFLYVAFRAYDEPDKVRATIPKRDSIFDDDWVGIFLDTFNDGRRAYELLFSPLGVQADAIFTEGGNEDFSVDIVMESKGAITSDGYVVEVAIPFKSLRYTAGEGKEWRIHFLRTIKRFNSEQSSWMPISRDNSSTLGQAGRITGLEGISTERTLEIIPSFTISETGQRVRTVSPHDVGTLAGGVDRGRFLNKPIETDFGLTAKYSITPNVTLDFAYNPDFAQVEADATVVTANQRFPIFFEEKRPFFLEGKEIFETLISAVHTRTIVDPDYAVKLSGKHGRNTFGALFASDNAPGNLSDEERDFILDPRNSPNARERLAKILDRNATVGILRLKRDVGKENHIGFLATTYNFIDRYNHVGGFDGRFRFNKTTTLRAQVLGSVTHRPFFYPQEGVVDDRKEKGLAYGAFLASNGRNWSYELGVVGRSRFYRADVGFNRRFNTNHTSLWVSYKSTEKPKNWLVSWRVFNFLGTSFDWQGRSQGVDNNTQLQLNFQKQSFFGVGVEEGYERVNEEEFGVSRNAPCASHPDPARRCRPAFFGGPERSTTTNTIYFFGGSTPSKKYSFFFLNVYNWGVLDFDFGAGPRFPRVSPAALELGENAPRDPGAGNNWFVESNFVYKPTDPLRVSLSYTKSRLTRQDTNRVAFDDNIFTLRATYQFTRFWFARARTDYTTLGARMRAQLLLGWTPNPGTTFFVGYNDDLNRNGFNPFTGELEPGFRRNGRTFFIKASYLFRRSF